MKTRAASLSNDEKMEKVMHELERRKKIVEKHIDFLNNHPKNFYSTECEYYENLSGFIYEALSILKNQDGYDYSDSESYLKSVEENYKKSPFLVSYRNVFGYNFANINAYIGKVIDNINSNHYPEEYYEIINVRDW